MGLIVAKKATQRSPHLPVVGTKLWMFHHDTHFHFEGGKPRKATYREKWGDGYVVDESRTSLYIGRFADTQRKRACRTDKSAWTADRAPHGYARTIEELEGILWKEEHAEAILLLVKHASPAQLSTIANVLHFIEPQGTIDRPDHLCLAGLSSLLIPMPSFGRGVASTPEPPGEASEPQP